VSGPVASRYHVRPPALDDVPAIYHLLARLDVAVIGHPDVTEADVRDGFAEPGYDPTTDGWLVTDAGGDAVGYAWVTGRGSSADIDADFFADADADPALPVYLLGLVEKRATEMGAALGHAEVGLAKGSYRAAVREAGLLAGAGYAVATTFSRLSITFDGEAQLAEPPPLPAGVRIAVCGADDVLRRTVHAVKEQAFVSHFRAVSRTYDEWLAALDSRSVTDWSQVLVAFLDGEPAGMLLADDSFVDSDNAGFVQNVGVLPAARGRGLAKLLLRTAFADMRRRGRSGAQLGVDTNNTTGALRLYESLGMRAVLHMDVWSKVLRTAR